MDNTELRHHCYAMGYSDGEVGAFYDGEITDYGKVYAKKYKEQLKEQKNE